MTENNRMVTGLFVKAEVECQVCHTRTPTEIEINTNPLSPFRPPNFPAAWVLPQKYEEMVRLCRGV